MTYRAHTEGRRSERERKRRRRLGHVAPFGIICMHRMSLAQVRSGIEETLRAIEREHGLFTQLPAG